MLDDAKAQGLVGRNAAELVNRVAPAHTDPGVLGVAERVDWTTHCWLLKLNRRSSDHLADRTPHKMGREQRRALLEQRRAAVVRLLRRLAIELADLDRQLDEIEQSER